MEGIDAIINMVAGYISVPLAAFSMKKSWSSKLRFALAAGLAVGIAYATVAIRGDALTAENVLAAFGISFAAQQATFHLEIPGAGDPTVVTKLEEIGVS